MMTQMQTSSLMQAIIVGGNTGMGLIIVGAILLALGIILGHFFPNRYWIALIVIGIILLAIGAILVALGSL